MLEAESHTAAGGADHPALRDDDGAIRAEFVARVRTALEAADAATLRRVVGDLHEADLGDLLEALDPD